MDSNITLDSLTALMAQLDAIPKPPRFFVGFGTDTARLVAMLKLDPETTRFMFDIDRYLPANFLRVSENGTEHIYDVRGEPVEVICYSRGVGA